MELGVKGFGAQHYLESVTKNMRRGLRKRAEQGLVIGGRTFGYDHVKLPGKRGTDRRINDAQAALVREVFEMYACGDSPKQIARALNDRRLPPDLVPGGKDMTRWSRHQVRETLQHILYTGKVVTTWDGERLEIDRPDLLIIKDDLWQATRQRFAQLRAEYARSQHGRLLGRPSHSIDSDYLLVGMIQCAICDGSMTATGRKRSGKKRHMYYQCLAAHDNRRRPCDNFVLAPMELTNRAVLQTIEDTVLNPSFLCDAIERVLARLDSPESREKEQTRLQTELAQVEQELKNLAQAIARSGIENNSFLAEVQTREHRRQEIVSEQTRLASLAYLSTLNLAAVVTALDTQFTEWKGAAGFAQRHVRFARTILKQFLLQKVQMAPQADGTYRFSGQAVIGPLIGRVLREQATVSVGSTVEAGSSGPTPTRPASTRSASPPGSRCRSWDSTERPTPASPRTT